MRIVEHSTKTTKYINVYVEGHREIRVEMNTSNRNSIPATTFDMWEEVDQPTRVKIIEEIMKRKETNDLPTQKEVEKALKTYHNYSNQK